MMMIMMTIMTKWLGVDFDCFFGVDFDFGYFWGPSCGGPGVSDCEGFQCHSWRAPTPNEPLQVPARMGAGWLPHTSEKLKSLQSLFISVTRRSRSDVSQ